METLDTIVVGAGQAGLAAGYHLQRAGRRFALLEAADGPGGSWPHYYTSLTLFSPARFSSLPGLPFPGDPERYPARQEVIDYLRGYAAHFRLPIVAGARVESATRVGERFVLETARGRFQARRLIAASGAFNRPSTPALPGQELFGGRQLHAFDYRDPAPFAGQRVVVVGAGNSAVQIAAELAGVAHVTLATRAPVRFVPQRPLGRDIHAWWGLLRLDTSPHDSPLGRLLASQAGGSPRVLDRGAYRAALAAGAPDQRAMFARLTPEGVVWADGAHEAVDAVIYATGYRLSLDYLAPLGALDADGQPLQRHGLSTAVPGLGYVGLPDQRSFASATLRGVGADAELVVRALHGAPARAWRRALGIIPCCPAPQAGA